MSDMEKKLLALVCINAYEVYLSTLHGCDARSRTDLRDFCKNPVPGDLVIETSTIWTRERDEHRFGKLLRKEWRQMYTAEEWAALDAEPNEPIPTELVWVIETLVGSEYTWTNADFIRVADEMAGVGERRARRAA